MYIKIELRELLEHPEIKRAIHDAIFEHLVPDLYFIHSINAEVIGSEPTISVELQTYPLTEQGEKK
jgi:hypothetical protein